jgi:hypothetical protein
MKKTPKYERFFAKGFDERFPLAWWRFVDPFAGFARFLEFGQHVADALHLPVAWDFYEARIELRSNFEKLVQDKVRMELCRSVNDWLNFYKERGYEIENGLGNIIMRDFVNALVGDRALGEQMATLQRMPVSRKALYYRIWALWDAGARYEGDIVHARVAGGK